jgi:hypothetical protein
MAAGKRAFQRSTAVDTLAAILHEEPEPIERVNPSGPAAPAPLRWVLERCLAKDPRERYAATLDLARDLSNLKEHASELSGPGAAFEVGSRRRRSLFTWATLAFAVLGGLGAALFLGSAEQSSSAPS